MANGWTLKRRARQSAAIRRWKPWERSTGPLTADGKANASRNADKGGRRPALRSELARVRELMQKLAMEQREGC